MLLTELEEPSDREQAKQAFRDGDFQRAVRVPARRSRG
jgi:Flp pilus assembly protein TadD